MQQARFALVGSTIASGLLLGFALAGCGANSKPPGVATAVSADARPAALANATSSVIEQYVAGVRKWVGCMRGEGYNLPDPDSKGKVDFSVLGDNRTLKADPKYLAAQTKCAPLQQAVPDVLIELPVLTPEQIHYAQAYARCMRANGEPTFPDPEANGWPKRPEAMPTLTDQQLAASLRAQQICAPVSEGRPSTTPDPNFTGQG